MRRYAAYLRYVVRHKWFVFLAFMRHAPVRGFVQAVLHDWTKLLPCEFFPYAKHFFNPDGTRRDVRNKDGSYDPNAQSAAFQKAWIHHQRSKHHWQAWASIGDNGEIKCVEIPTKYISEMIMDWVGAGMAINGEENPLEWYKANRGKMVMHPKTKEILWFVMHALFCKKGDISASFYGANKEANDAE